MCITRHAPLLRSQARRGSALVVVALLAIVFGAFAASLTDITLSGMRQQGERRGQLELAIAAESAANLAHREVSRRISTLMVEMGEGDTRTLDLDTIYPDIDTFINGCRMVATVTRLIDNGVDNSAFLVRGTAQLGEDDDPMRRRHRVEYVLQTRRSEAFSRAMFAIAGFDFMGSASTDSWNSAEGPYSAATASNNGDLGSMGNIDVQNPANVQGQVYPNQEAAIPTFSYHDAWDTIVAGGYHVPLGPVEMRGGELSLDDSAPYLLDSLNLRSQGQDHPKIRIEGEVVLFIDGPIEWASNCQAIFDYATPDSRLTIYQSDHDGGNSNITIHSSGVGAFERDASGDIVDGSARPEQFRLFTEYSGQVTMNGNGQFSGTIFAPQATFKLNGTHHYFGSLVAGAFSTQVLSDPDEMGKVNGNFHFHYDEMLDAINDATAVAVVVTGWSSTALGFDGD